MGIRWAGRAVAFASRLGSGNTSGNTSSVNIIRPRVAAGNPKRFPTPPRAGQRLAGRGGSLSRTHWILMKKLLGSILQFQSS